MNSWLDKPGSLSLGNAKTLGRKISNIEENISSIKNNILSFLSNVDQWESQCKSLIQMSSKQQLTAKHILEVNYWLELTKIFNEDISACNEKLQSFNENSSGMSILGS